MKNLLLLVTACALFTAACHSFHDESHSTVTYEVPETVEEKLPSLAKSGKYDEALSLLRPYAKKGNPQAQFDMAIGLVMKGEKSNDNEIVNWVRMAASQDYPQLWAFWQTAINGENMACQQTT